MEWFDAGFLSQEVSATFPPEVIEQAQQQGEQAEGQILDVAILSDPSIFDDWMEVSVRVTTENSTHDYLVVFHLEAGDWKLFGTQLLD